MKDKIKIIYLINGLGSGGAEMMLYRLLEHLDRSRFEPEVIALLDLEGPVKGKIEKLGVPVEVLAMGSKLDLRAVIELYRLLKQRKPNILHGQLFAADILARLLGRLAGVPVIISSIRNERYGGRLRDFVIKWSERFTMRTTIVSKAAAGRFIKDGVIPAEKLLVIYNGIDPEKFKSGLSKDEKLEERRKFGLPEERFIFLAVGSLTSQKGYSVLLEALSRLKSYGDKVALVVAGSGEMEGELKAKVTELGLVEKVFFLGRSDDVPGLMASADALVLSSYWEGLPGVVLEAMASELPVVATAVGGTPELVEEGVTGYLVPAGSIEKLAKAMEQILLMTHDELQKMGWAGRSRVEEQFYLKQMVSSYEELYNECLREKNIVKVDECNV